MAERNSTLIKHAETSQVVGFRIPKRLARELKAEAAKRGLKLNQLLAEMWELYKKRK